MVCAGGDHGQVDHRWIERQRTWRQWTGFPVRVHLAEAGLVSGKGRAIGIWGDCSVDDASGVTVQSVAGGVEGIEEVVGSAGVGHP